MKIKVKDLSYDEVLALKPEKHHKPMRPHFIFRLILRIASWFLLLKNRYTYNCIGMEKLNKDEPAFYLMNHSAFVDLLIAVYTLFPRPVNIVASTDAFVGKNLLMRLIGCIPARKFVSDIRLVKDMLHAVRKNKTSVLMYPEAGYSFDGTSTTIADSIGKCIKMLGIPVVMITTHGAFHHDPLYNGLQLRKVKVTADVKYLLSPDEIKEMSEAEINEIVYKEFAFDNFRWQQENGIKIKEKFRADYLNRVLYKCPNCLSEGSTVGDGIHLTCTACGKVYELTEDGYIKALNGKTEFNHIPDWYAWERECVRREVENGTYNLDVPVDILMAVNSKCIYRVGEGNLKHSLNGFELSGCDGKLDFKLRPSATYCINSDFLWYELGDMISIGDTKAFYYCFPKTKGDIVAKTRLATEELYKFGKALKN